MQLFLSNTLTKKKEEFVPIDPTQVKIYSCGPTVYRDAHIGNMRAFTFADLLNKVIKNILGYPVLHVMNLTDVGHLKGDGSDGEDKMQIGAKREGLTARELADRYSERFFFSKDAMRLTAFDLFPKATDHIPEQIAMIQTLEAKGYTYSIADDGIYMDTARVPHYGALAGLENQEQLGGARIHNDAKRHPNDFALRKVSLPEEQRHMERPSPRGVGYPGWHIECSAMACKYLGDRFDIHTGGVDHIGVHHPNEIAQTECCTGHKRVNYRLHNQMLNLGGKKMAKSEGGLITIQTLQEKGYDALDLKYLFATGQYAQFLDFDWELLDGARQARTKINKSLQPYLSATDIFLGYSLQEFRDGLTTDAARALLDGCTEALCDDLNTPKMLALIHPALKTIDQSIASVIVWLDSNILMLGLGDRIDHEPIPDAVRELADRRLKAKQSKDWEAADALRNELSDHGWVVKDVADGYELEKKG